MCLSRGRKLDISFGLIASFATCFLAVCSWFIPWLLAWAACCSLLAWVACLAATETQERPALILRRGGSATVQPLLCFVTLHLLTLPMFSYYSISHMTFNNEFGSKEIIVYLTFVLIHLKVLPFLEASSYNILSVIWKISRSHLGDFLGAMIMLKAKASEYLQIFAAIHIG